jgi:AcrR family transcriptional regulator
MPKQTFFNLSEEKRQRILEGAKDVFSQNHYKDVTIDRIVALAKIPKGSFYQYFSNKDDLFKYMFSDLGIDKKKELMNEIKKKKNLSFLQLLSQMVIKAEQFEKKDETMLALKERFLKETSQEVKDEILSQMIPDTMEIFQELINAYIQDHVFREEIDVKAAAFILTTVTMNVEKYPLENEENYGEALLGVCRLLETGLAR